MVNVIVGSGVSTLVVELIFVLVVVSVVVVIVVVVVVILSVAGVDIASPSVISFPHRLPTSISSEDATTTSGGNHGNSSPTGQDPGTTNPHTKFSAHVVLILVSNGDGFGTKFAPALRKNASWRASTVTIEVRLGSKSGAISARVAAMSSTAPMPTVVMVCARARNSLVLETGNRYVQGWRDGWL